MSSHPRAAYLVERKGIDRLRAVVSGQVGALAHTRARAVAGAHRGPVRRIRARRKVASLVPSVALLAWQHMVLKGWTTFW